MNRCAWLIALGLFVFTSVSAAAADRITLNDGDTFLGQISGEENQRYRVDRYGFMQLIPKWWIKKVERNTAELIPADSGIVLEPTKTIEIRGKSITVNSNPPAYASTLNLGPPYYYYWVEGNRFLYGYLVNDTEENFHTMQLQLLYFGQGGRKLILRQEVEIFKVYGMTIKPFMIDTREVPWERIERIYIWCASRSVMRRIQ